MKKILLAISGSIAFYKAYELISLFKKDDIYVKVLLSKGALRFCSPLGFEALANEVLYEQNESWQNDHTHIAFSKDCDAVLFAPACISSICKLAHGIADNLFTQTLLALDPSKPLLIAPAANTNMYLHFSAQNALVLLAKNGAKIIPPISKRLACKDEGIGALASIDEIYARTKRALLCSSFWLDKSVVITGGGTREKIDDVRCISNFSSGKMARAVADAFYFAGANVTLISSALSAYTPYTSIAFESSSELYELMQKHNKQDYLIMLAAVSDFVPVKQAYGKLKKADFADGFSLMLTLNQDLLKNYHFNGKKIGFKMEFDASNALLNAQKMLKAKNLDMVCLNVLNKKMSFGSDENELVFIDKNTTSKSTGCLSKTKLASLLVKRCEAL